MLQFYLRHIVCTDRNRGARTYLFGITQERGRCRCRWSVALRWEGCKKTLSLTNSRAGWRKGSRIPIAVPALAQTQRSPPAAVAARWGPKPPGTQPQNSLSEWG